MKNFLSSKKNINFVLGFLIAVIFAQALFIGRLYSEKDDKLYQVNLVPVKTEKDSVDYGEMKNNLMLVDRTVKQLRSFFTTKDIQVPNVEMLSQDSLGNVVYVSKQSQRYSQYLAELQLKLQQVPLGIPADGYISSLFGKRVNPIPPKNVVLASLTPTKTKTQKVVERDSLGNVIKSETAAKLVQNNAPAEKDQIQFHKGLDIAVAHGSEVRSAAAGKVIFAGVKGGYGNCVIISHGNGLDTLYGHLAEILVKANDVVRVNDVIAKSGNTGRSTGPHLHYEVHKNNTPVNPNLFMSL